MIKNVLQGLELDFGFENSSKWWHFYAAYFLGCYYGVTKAKRIIAENLLSASVPLPEACYWIARAGLSFGVLFLGIITGVGMLDMAGAEEGSDKEALLKKITLDRGKVLLLIMGVELVMLYLGEYVWNYVSVS